MKGTNVNENLIAVLIVLMAIGLASLGLDDGSLVKTVVSAYLGFLVGKRYPGKEEGGDSD